MSDDSPKTNKFVQFFQSLGNKLRLWFKERQQKVPPRAVGVSLSQLGLMLRNGIDIATALETLQVQTEYPFLGEAYKTIADKVIQRGWTISRGMRQYPKLFPPTVILFVQSGEEVGNISERLAKAATIIERSQEIHQRFMQAIRNPLVTATAATLLILGIVKFAIPKFVSIYTEMQVELPLISKLVLLIVGVVNHPFTAVLFILTSLIFFFYWDQIKQTLASISINLPVLGDTFSAFLCTELCYILGTLSEEGIPLNRSLRLLESSTPYNFHREALGRAVRTLEDSGDITFALASIPYFPKLLVSMATVAQESGAVGQMMFSLSNILNQELDARIDSFLSMLEPIIVAGLGFVMGFFFIGCFLPIYGIINQLG